MRRGLGNLSKKPWFKWVVTVIIIPALMGSCFQLGSWYQGQQDQRQLQQLQQQLQQNQQQSNGKLNGISCQEAELLALDYNAEGQSANVISNPNGTCSVGFVFSITNYSSECISIVVSRTNGSVTTQNGCSTTTSASVSAASSGP